MRCLFTKILTAGLMVLGFFILNSSAHAQYQVFTWDNFETGEFPASLIRMHGASPENVSVYEYPKTGAPAGMITPASQIECGRYGLKFQSTEKKKFLTLLTPLTLNRQQIGQKGRALFQADFFVSDAETYFPNIAVVAYGKLDKGKEAKYRFGVLGNKSLYFSFLDGKKPEPVLLQQQTFESFGLTRPGWHRFQIIFEGQDKIYLAVDGRYTSFSPITEPSVTNLQLGIMLAGQNTPRSCFLDNLSVQWTPEDVPLPESPWEIADKTKAPAGAAQNSANASVSGGTPSVSPSAPLSWLTSADDAWKQSSSAQRPLLVYFQVPRSKPCIGFESLLQNDKATAAQMAKFICLKVDLNTLSGGMIGRKFNIFRVPCLIVISPDGKERSRQIFAKDVTQEAVSAFLQKAVTP